MNLVLFIMVLVTSFIIVRIGAVAFQLTGLEWSLAKFQSLSCFTATGFTTREAELITGDPRRRRVASVLMVLGHAGLVTMIATFANSLRPSEGQERLKLPFLPDVIPSSMVPWINLITIMAAIWIVYRLFSNTRLARALTKAIRKKMAKGKIVKPVSFQELVVATAGYGVSKIKVQRGHSVLEKALAESDLRRDDITVLAIIRGEETMANPSGNARILAGDEIICFGKLSNIREKFA